MELDPAVVEVQRRNPWSTELFEHALIDRRVCDVTEVIDELGDGEFDAILHDPPVIDLAGDLYGRSFYQQLLRVLKPGRCLFHYVGNPESPSGARTMRGVVDRLREVGFADVKRENSAFGLSAYRP